MSEIEKVMTQHALIKRAARDALDVQNASNLSGVILAWGRHQTALKDACGGNTREYHTHPVNVLFLSKIVSLMVVETDCLGGVKIPGPDSKMHDTYAEAYRWAEEVQTR